MMFSAEELDYLRQYFNCPSHEIGGSLAQTIDRWKKTVEDVIEHGYSDDLFEFKNDLLLRDSIEEIAVDAPASLQLKIRLATDELDEKFMKATIRASEHIWTPKDSRISSRVQVWDRIPAIPGPRLKHHLELEGIRGLTQT